MVNSRNGSSKLSDIQDASAEKHGLRTAAILASGKRRVGNHNSGNHHFIMFPLCYENAFLDASSHLYKSVCPSVGPSVRRSVRMYVMLL